MNEPEFERRVADRLAAAEKRLQDSAADAPDVRVAELTSHVVRVGGKRLRPLLVVLGAEFGNWWTDGVLQAAVVVELVHVSSLYHDDVMDAAATRHGVPSAHVRWGERTAVLGGDWLLARSAQLAAGLGPQVLRVNARTAGRLVSGQMRELVGPAPGEDPVSHYFQVTAGKTAALLAMALEIGALQAGAPEAYTAALSTYGEHLGAAFQIADDLLDLTAPPGDTGKEQGKDLLAGVPSLPALLARADDSSEGAELRALLTGGAVTDPADHRRALELFRDAPARQRAVGLMHQRLDLAREALEVLPPLPARRALDLLCDYVALRSS
ncbi:polyprenyl diphosphate synthase [Streptomyces sp. CB03234]|nr:polyprenyl diphosphate synthase [Streptomyces sp. CB03234]